MKTSAISKNRDNLIKPLVIGEAVSMIFVLIGTALVSYCKLEKGLAEQGEKWGTTLLVFLSVMIGGVITIKLSNNRTLMTCVLYTGSFVAMQLIVSMLFFEGISTMLWGRGVIALLGALCSLAICHMGVKNRPFHKMLSR